MITSQDYTRAESFLPWNLKKRIFHAEVKPNFIQNDGESTDAFWYLEQGKHGNRFLYVDPENEIYRPLFDHVIFASAFSLASGTACTHEALPFDQVEMRDQGKKLRFKVLDQSWECDLTGYKFTKVDAPVKQRPGELLSPDERWAAFQKDHNLWVRAVETGDMKQLTFDGVQHFNYGCSPESNTSAVTMRLSGAPIPPMAIWSPDSRKLLT